MLTIEYADGFSREFGYDELASLTGSARVEDVSTLDERRQGTGVRFESLVEKKRLKDASEVTLVSSEDRFQVTMPVAIAMEQGMVLFSLNGNPLTVEKGGPLRFFMPKTVSCQTKDLPAGVLDNCANLKHLVRVRIGKSTGRTKTRRGRHFQKSIIRPRRFVHFLTRGEGSERKSSALRLAFVEWDGA